MESSMRMQELRLEEVKQKIADLQKQIDQNEVKKTLKEECPHEIPIPSVFNMIPKKTLMNRDGSSSMNGKKTGVVDEPIVPINCVTFNQNEQFVD